MASTKTIQIVKQTEPVLAKYKEDITSTFYKNLFEQHPELKDIFNMTHQANGLQAKVLANAIFHYSKYIDQLEMLSGAVEQIAQKHASLAISPEMYDIVGAGLLEAIKEVLGEAATPEIIEAWAEAYGDLAGIFIQREEQIYKDFEVKPGGWRGYKSYAVVKKEVESETITSFYLKPCDGKGCPEFLPGQYISVRVKGDAHSHTRNYSLSDSPGKDYLRISIKKEPAVKDFAQGVVSNYFHKEVEEGSLINLGIPSGEFTLKPGDKPVVLLSGGVGVTPLMSMLNALMEQGKRTVYFLHAAKNSGTHAFASHVRQLSDQSGLLKSYVFYDEPLEKDLCGKDYDYQGLVSETVLRSILPSVEMDFYFCGPTPFMQNILSILRELGVAESNIHYEFFGPSEELNAVPSVE
ncbi:NO-inducible flavohemoprotein [Rapidithrix thailandica]|uniref:Flavohemoprotein n=1 Tax=Rapidithrix thailandica TaxID=413964 RepID=A0AAW9S3W0_9BACT